MLPSLRGCDDNDQDMLLFQKRFHTGILDGSITITFRQWEKAHVKPGGRYRVHPVGVVVVDSLERIAIETITEHDAARSGFTGRSELLEYLGRYSESAFLTPESEVWRIVFHHGGEDDRIDQALDGSLTDELFAELQRKLDGYDTRSASGPWTRRTLKVIEKNPRIAASKLAPKLKLDTLPFKANVVKLKKLGLTMSFEVGYEVSPRGRAFMKRDGSPRKRR